jgi:hypothetical protein
MALLDPYEYVNMKIKFVTRGQGELC